ncbi:hypothetical protein [Georgenia daeguensis]|uniref:Uncharacterized protein n=1 Tax=Georgenia daeguensis TaxID=908355 RepID=A0ABP8EYJ2_9MICO
MPTFRVEYADETQRVVDAHRVVRVGEEITFENLVSRGTWDRVLRVPAESVRAIRRSVLEAGNYRHYLPAQPLVISPVGRS